jgi:hypothetical protein
MSPEAKKGWMILAGLGIFAMGLIFGSAADPTTTTSSEPQPTITTTVPGPAGETVTVTPPPVTKTVPGPKVTVTAPPPQAAAAITEDGIYLVGVDIKPGTYRSGPNPDCYWARLSDTNGDLDSILANNNGGNQVVTIKRTDKAFETARCGEWTRVK